MPFPATTHLNTPRLTLRPVVAGDVPDLLEVNGDPEVTRFLPFATWESAQDGLAWLARMDAIASAGTGQQLVVVRNSDSKVIGTVLMFRFDEASCRFELGYVLGRKYWRQGFMAEALNAACAHAFEALRMRRIEAEVNPSNTAPNRLLLSMGFALEGTLRKRWVTKGVAYDTNFYGCLADDWRRGADAAVRAAR